MSDSLRPFGLVRYGVAPDHPRLKSTIKVFERIAQRDFFNLRGNVEVGKRCRSASAKTQLRRGRYSRTAHVVVARSTSRATSSRVVIWRPTFVGWYNGHPDFADLQFDFNCRSAAVVGNGNVALDIARILVQPLDVLEETDIATHALDALAASQIRDVHVIGRRGPAQASFTNMELRELGEIRGVSPVVDSEQLRTTAATDEELADKK